MTSPKRKTRQIDASYPMKQGNVELGRDLHGFSSLQKGAKIGNKGKTEDAREEIS